ncbi:MAG: putative transport system ATP-binding protein [Verrucomicrobiota bacterium]|jgi:putative ABC transport system ATP-binding protein
MPSDSRNPLIETRDLRRSFDGGRVEALRGVSITIAEGESVAVAGPSGCGKSTLLQMLGALDEPTEGDVLFRGQSLRQIRDHSLFRARTIGFVFQSFHLLPTLSALENVQMPMFEMKWPPKQRRAKAVELLNAVGLGERLSHLPRKLSGGERQRVAIARSLANEPKLLLADEPTGNLDSSNAARIIDLLLQIHRQQNMTIIIVTHDLDIAGRTDRIVRMLDGQIITDAPAS